jgi:gamma-glutamylcyclotransferase (GGCT)/AIG2-like uncharacterized protein YtfP
MTTKLYWAYGSNLNVAHMARRCPKAKKVRPLIVGDAALVFRHVADVTERADCVVPGGLWRITRECEAALDRYEGVASRLYLKREIEVKVDGVYENVLFYQMRESVGIMPPGEAYLGTIVQGYKDFGLDLEILDAYLQESWGEKKITEVLARRRISRGEASLARRIKLGKKSKLAKA